MTYQELIQQMNQAMLAAESDRVALLRYVLKQLGNPEKSYHIVHIVGTNGKGSTGTLIGNLLQNSNFKVGHFSSPAIHDAREQITLNNQLISESDFVDTYEKIVNQLAADFDMNQLSIFEWFVIIMLQYFSDRQVEWAIIEAGLGGVMDATNAISSPLITIVTHIDLDHTAILGDTIKKIAYNKSGVIKYGTTVFMAPNQKFDAKSTISNRVVERDAKQLIDAEYVKIDVLSETEIGFKLNILSKELKNISIDLGMLGEFQIDNLKTVIAVYDWLVANNVPVTIQSLSQTLEQTKISGRMQIVHKHPTVIIDAAHNPDSAQRLIQSLKAVYPKNHLQFVLGFLQDKNYLEMAQIYAQAGTKIVVVTPDNPQRALPAIQLQKVISGSVMAADAQTGLDRLLEASTEQDIIIVTGSFYTIKEIEGI